MRTQEKQRLAQLRHWRVRKKIRGTSERPRLSACFTCQHIYVQIIDDQAGVTLVSASSDEKARPVAGGGNVAGASTGSGAARRKNKTAHKTAGDDKKLNAQLKKMNLQEIKGIEEVNMFKANDEVLHITDVKLQASVASNTFVISGRVENKTLTDLMPGIVMQLSQEHIAKIMSQYTSAGARGGTAGAAVAPSVPSVPEEEEEEDDEQIPDLVDNFEEAAK